MICGRPLLPSGSSRASPAGRFVPRNSSRTRRRAPSPRPRDGGGRDDPRSAAGDRAASPSPRRDHPHRRRRRPAHGRACDCPSVRTIPSFDAGAITRPTIIAMHRSRCRARARDRAAWARLKAAGHRQRRVRHARPGASARSGTRPRRPSASGRPGPGGSRRSPAAGRWERFASVCFLTLPSWR